MAFRAIAADVDVGAVIVTGNGRAFCAGRAKELSFTGNFLDAERALAWGLVNRVVAPEELLPTCRSLARDMLSCDRATLLAVKRVYDKGYRTTLAEGLRIEGRIAVEHARAVRPEQIAARRRGVLERGRLQSR